MDILVSTGTGHARRTNSRTTIYAKTESTYLLKLKSSRAVLTEIQKKFVASYKAAGGDIQFEIYEGAVHEWVAEPGPLTDRAQEMVKAFIARQLNA